ncbi:MAG: hypothetical protein JSS72_10120 [Armatimonadetes bacterium]|nr:hypothetical protein [Armatimonadota bacterium]
MPPDFRHIYKANDAAVYAWSAEVSMHGLTINGKLTEKVAKVEGDNASLEWSISDVDNSPIQFNPSLAGVSKGGLLDALEPGIEFEVYKVFNLANLLPEKALEEGKPLEVNLKNDHMEIKGKFTAATIDPKTHDATVEGTFDVANDSETITYTVKSVFDSTTHRLMKSDISYEMRNGKIVFKIGLAK